MYTMTMKIGEDADGSAHAASHFECDESEDLNLATVAAFVKRAVRGAGFGFVREVQFITDSGVYHSSGYVDGECHTDEGPDGALRK